MYTRLNLKLTPPILPTRIATSQLHTVWTVTNIQSLRGTAVGSMPLFCALLFQHKKTKQVNKHQFIQIA